MSGPGVKVPLYAAVLATGAAFSVLFTGDVAGGWLGHSNTLAAVGGAFVTMLGAALVAALVGSAGRYRFVLLFPAAAVYTIVAVYGLPPLLSPGEWREFCFGVGNDVYEAGNIMYVVPIPYDLAPGLFVVLLPVVMIVGTFATSATLYEESPVISVAVLGVTIAVLSTISFEDGAGPFFALFLVSSVALLLHTAGQRAGAGPGSGTGPRAGSRVGSRAGSRAGLVAGAVVVVVVLAVPKMPFADATVSAGAIDWTRIGTGGTSRLDVQADVGDYLTAGREAELFRVQSSEPLFWRGGTLDFFDGARWSDTTGPGADDGEEISRNVEIRPVVQEVEVLNAETDLVFGGYKIQRTSLESWDVEKNSDGSWSLDEPSEEGDEYTVLSEVPQPTAAQLRDAGGDYPAAVREKFLQLPEDRPAVIAETAETVTRRYDPATPYEEARAVERYLVADGGFTYNLDVNYRRADEAIEEFLGDGKEGFCTQFATSMALVLREMGVPTRVVYGSTEGELVEDDEYLVRGSNMHTWVEAYFPGVGWYPFNPTPGTPLPGAMEANAPRQDFSPAGQSPLQENNFAQRELADEETPQQRRETPTENANGGGASGDEEPLPAWPLLLLAPALLAGAVLLAKRLPAARGRPEDLYADLTGRLRDALPPGAGATAGGAGPDSRALTPTERVLLLAGAAGVEEAPMRDFAHAYSEHLYSPPPGEAGEAGEAGRLGTSRRVSSAYRGALRAYGRLPLRRRVLAALNPASLLSRAGQNASSWRARALKTLRRKLGGSRGSSRGR